MRPPPSLSISPSPLPLPKAKLHTRKHTHTQTPSCTITLFEDRDACSLHRRTVYVKPRGLFVRSKGMCVCVSGVEGGLWWWWRKRRRWGEVRTSSLPDSDAVRAATMAACSSTGGTFNTLSADRETARGEGWMRT